MRVGYARRVLVRYAAVAAVGLLSLLAVATAPAQAPRGPRVWFTAAPKITLPGRIDSNSPFIWHVENGAPVLTVMTSWGGKPELGRGSAVDALTPAGNITVLDPPGEGTWFESIVADAQGRWYGYYHHERPADECGRPERQLPRIGAARSLDFGRTWQNLGMILDAPAGSNACGSTNRFVLGGVGDVAAILDARGQDLYLYYSQYPQTPSLQGVAVARLAWADRDAPVGKVSVWSAGAWLPARNVSAIGDPPQWDYPAGTPLVGATQPFHDGQPRADVFWGPAIHWNTYLERYVMLVNRAKDEQFGSDGVYVAYSTDLGNPRSWTEPVKIVNGGGWYPQVVGLERGTGTDREAGQRARFFLTGVSTGIIEFRK